VAVCVLPASGPRLRRCKTVSTASTAQLFRPPREVVRSRKFWGGHQRLPLPHKNEMVTCSRPAAAFRHWPLLMELAKKKHPATGCPAPNDTSNKRRNVFTPKTHDLCGLDVTITAPARWTRRVLDCCPKRSRQAGQEWKVRRRTRVYQIAPAKGVQRDNGTNLHVQTPLGNTNFVFPAQKLRRAEPATWTLSKRRSRAGSPQAEGVDPPPRSARRLPPPATIPEYCGGTGTPGLIP